MSIASWSIVVLSVVIVTTVIVSELNKRRQQHFYNAEVSYNVSASNFWKITKAYFTTKRRAAIPSGKIPVQLLTNAQLMDVKGDTIYRLGHSTLLLKVSGKFILIDPVFSERASPFQWFGPKRFHNSPISLEELPHIDAVIISHDHYDHLDEAAIKRLNNKVEHFVTPLKVGSHLKSWGVPQEKIVELDWWHEYSFDNITLTATPAQHFSGRGVFDKDQTLWASWVISSDNSNLFFSGDSGYFSGFKQIGERYGPFDVTMIETGAYNELWSEIHMHPHESVKAHIDLKGRYMLPVHNGTFDLALHDWYEPLELVIKEGNKNNVAVLTPEFGQAVAIGQPNLTSKWWRSSVENLNLLPISQ